MFCSGRDTRTEDGAHHHQQVLKGQRAVFLLTEKPYDTLSKRIAAEARQMTGLLQANLALRSALSYDAVNRFLCFGTMGPGLRLCMKVPRTSGCQDPPSQASRTTPITSELPFASGQRFWRTVFAAPWKVCAQPFWSPFENQIAEQQAYCHELRCG